MTKRSKPKKVLTAFFNAAFEAPKNVPWLVPIIVAILEKFNDDNIGGGITPEQFDDALIAAALVGFGLASIKEAVELLTNPEESRFRNLFRLAQYVKFFAIDLLLPICMSIFYLGKNWGNMDFIRANDETGLPSTYESAKLILCLCVVIPCAVFANRNFIYQEVMRFKNANQNSNSENPLEKNFDDKIYKAFSDFWSCINKKQPSLSRSTQDLDERKKLQPNSSNKKTVTFAENQETEENSI